MSINDPPATAMFQMALYPESECYERLLPDVLREQCLWTEFICEQAVMQLCV